MGELDILLTFAGGLAGALVLGYFADRLKLSPIVGYLLAGVAVGPFTPGFVANRAIADQFAEIGVILLMFGIGLRFHLRELIAVWRIAVPGALIQSAVSTTALAVLLHLMGWDWTSGFILGMAISVASTVVMAIVLAGRHDLHARIGHIAIGWTVVEDLLTVALLLLLPVIFVPDKSANSNVLIVLGLASVKILVLMGLVVVLGRWVIPWVLERIVRSHSRDLFTLAILVLALGIAVGAAKGFGVSIALGAFLAGLAVGRSEFAARAANDAVPMRDAFAVLFFVSVGMLFDPRSLLQIPLIIAIVLLVVIGIKPLSAMLTVRALGVPLQSAVPIGAAFAQVGEFSFILGSVALELGLIDHDGWNALIVASIISIAVNPFMYDLARRWSSSVPERAAMPVSRPSVIHEDRCILVGYGPVGKTVHHLLDALGKLVMIVDLNLDTVRALKAEGQSALYGDVLRRGTLEEAGITVASSLILSADVENAAEIIRYARSLNPGLTVLARCAHLRDAPAMHRAGARVVIAAEAEVGVALVEALTPDDAVEFSATLHSREAVRARLYALENRNR